MSDFLTQRQFLITHSPNAFGLASAMATRREGRWWLLLSFFPAERRPNIDPTHVRLLSPEGRRISHLEVRRPRRSPAEKAGFLSLSAEQAVVFVLATEDEEAARRLAADTTPYLVELLEVENLDPFFSRARLQFATGEATTAEPSPGLRAVTRQVEPPEDVDYLAKDYESFRKLMLDHMARSVPEWKERNASDLGVTIIEALAYAADYSSYFQDAVGTEAYLQTARRRVSVRRHGVLLDYQLGEGATPRAWIFVRVAEAEGSDREPTLSDQPIYLPQGAQFLADSGRRGVIPYPSLDYDRALRDDAGAFETLYGQVLRPSLNRIEIYAWRVTDFELEAGVTSAALVGDFCDRLAAGDVVLFEQRRAENEDEVDFSKRQVVRLCRDPRPAGDPLDPQATLTEIEWYPEDALRFALPVRRHATGKEDLAVARGNLVLADLGRTTFEELPPVPLARPFRPRLDQVGKRYRLVYHQPYILRQELHRPASAVAEQRAEELVPALTLAELDESSWIEQGTVIDPIDSRRWSPDRDLVRCDRFERAFVAESENDGTVALRFGDGHFGQRPAAGSVFRAFYRVADAKSSAVGPGTGACLVIAGTTGEGGPPVMPPDLEVRVESASFPVGAVGGALPETDEHARLFAPAMVTRQERVVTAEDFAARARGLVEVNDAWAELEWGGSWTLATLRVQRSAGRPEDAAFRRSVAEAFNGRLVMGYQLSVLPPSQVPLDIAITVRLESHVDSLTVESRLTEALGTGMVHGEPAFFNPDAFGFGDAVELDDLVAAALAVAGVLDVEVTRFRPLAAATGHELDKGVIVIAPQEVAEFGRLDITWKTSS